MTYPFPVDPPHVPDRNPAGEYRRRFTLPPDWDSSGSAVVRFDGVDSCFAVFVNGAGVGHSQGSRLVREFDVTHLVRLEDNVIAVRVHQWSAGSYLEDQDMWWLSGIFRGVTLINERAGAVRDFFVHADYDAGRGTGLLRLDTSGPATLSVPELGIEGAQAGAEHRIPDAEPWSDEHPRLYDAVLTSPKSVIGVRIGFRRIEVRDGQIRLNGNVIQFRGVNRHEWHPVDPRPRPGTADPLRGRARVHDGNFVIDGLVFPDRTPSPGLFEAKAVFSPVRITIDPAARSIMVANRHHTMSTDGYRFGWTVESTSRPTGTGPARCPRSGCGSCWTRPSRR